MSLQSCKTYIQYALLEALEADDADNRVIVQDNVLLAQVWDNFDGDGDGSESDEGYQRLFKVTVEPFELSPVKDQGPAVGSNETPLVSPNLPDFNREPKKALEANTLRAPKGVTITNNTTPITRSERILREVAERMGYPLASKDAA